MPWRLHLSLEEVTNARRQGVREGATEFQLLAGCTQNLSFDQFLEMNQRAEATAPQLHLKAFTMVEVHCFCPYREAAIEETLKK